MTWEKAAGIVRALVLFGAGAGVMVCYLHLTLVPKVAQVEWMFHQLLPLWFVLSLVESYFQSKREPRSERSLPGGSSAQTGTAVVLATGGAAAYGLARDYRQPGDLIAPVLVVLVTIVIAAAVFRFARRHADEIGEARFDTRNREQW